MAQPHTRVTLKGTRRHVDLLLPSTAEVGTLMPRILELVGDTPGERVATKVLLTSTGESIPAGATLADAGVLDGAHLTLFSHEDAPPPAVVYDISDTVVEQAEDIGGQWTRRQLAAASGVFSALGLLLALEITFGSLLPDQRWWSYLGFGAVLLGLGAAVAAASKPVAATLMTAGWGVALLGLFHWDAAGPARVLLAAAATAALTACLATVVRQPRSALTAAGVMAALTGVWTLALPLTEWAASGDPAGQAAGIGGFAGICSVLTLGLLPGIALSASGLATLDDRRATGSAIWRRDALAAIRAAHRGLTLSTVATAVSAGLAMWMVAADASRPAWSLPLVFALALATLLRARSFPMAIERHALYAAAGIGASAGSLALAALGPGTVWIVGAGVLAVSLLIALGLGVTLPEHTGARLRQVAERVEVLAILATVPLLVGYFGVFSTMLATF